MLHSINEAQVAQTAAICRSRGIILPTFAQQRDPALIPREVVDALRHIGLWDVHPLNLFRITWKNDPATGGFGGVNFMELPRDLTGVKARIFALVGKFFPTGAHKVGATYGCLVPRLVTGNFDPKTHKAVWPSTGNFCRGGAFNCALLGCKSIAILPEGMSRERFEWLRAIGSEVIATPGCESNVKEIYDKCKELSSSRSDIVILNQFEEFGNGMWHYEVTGSALLEVFESVSRPGDRFFAFVCATGSAGTIAAGTRLKEVFPQVKVVAVESLQCPTLLQNGFGAHRIEGIGDKHVPWIHDVRSTDVVIAVDDRDVMALMRLFNEEVGRETLLSQGVPKQTVERLDLIGISGLANLIASIKTAKWFEADEHDLIFTVFTDSMELYQSRLQELEAAEGPYTREQALVDLHCRVYGLKTDAMMELDHPTKRRIHNLKYYTWIEQQGKDVRELEAQWYEYKTYWTERFGLASAYDRLIEAFNERIRAA